MNYEIPDRPEPRDESLEIRQCRCGAEFDTDPRGEEYECEDCRPSLYSTQEDQPITDTVAQLEAWDELIARAGDMGIDIEPLNLPDACHVRGPD